MGKRDIFIFAVALWAAAVLNERRHESAPTSGRQQQRLEQAARAATDAVAPTMLDSRYQHGRVDLLDPPQSVHDREITRWLKGAHAPPRASTMYWRFGRPYAVAASANAVDRHHYYVNSYLVGFTPFPAESLWVPLYTIAARKLYQTDHAQYGEDEVWQNSAQSYVAPRGDCEDHAVLLADWLIASGVDARVVLGQYKNDGHAWVVAMRDGQAFLLEATSKRRYRSWNAYPLAAVAADYHPQVMFNRDTFWLNTGSLDSRDYQGQQWRVMSRFVAEPVAD